MISTVKEFAILDWLGTKKNAKKSFDGFMDKLGNILKIL